MENLITKEEIDKINEMMLRKGAPTVKDNVGYNTYHYFIMSDLAKNEVYTPKQLLLVLRIMDNYTNTQLQEYKEKIKNSIKYVERTNQTEPIVKRKIIENNIKIHSYNNVTVGISWNYNEKIKDFVKTIDKNNGKWEKVNDEFIYYIRWDFIEPLLNEFKKENFNINHILELRNHLNDNPVLEKINIKRKDAELLEITGGFELNTVLKGLDYIAYEYKKYYMKIYLSSKLYKDLEKCGIEFDLSELKPWKELVESWNEEYEMMDLSKRDLPFEPYPFQIEDIKTMLKSHTLLNANDMGCGKTFESVVTGESIYNKKKLVICPASLRLNWKKEIQMVNPSADIKVLYNNEDFETGKDWTIIGYPSVTKFLDELENERFQVIFIDEAHYCQAINVYGNPTSNRAEAILRLAATAGYVYPLTGTPKPTRTKNIYNILRMIKHPLAMRKDSFYEFADRYCAAYHSDFGYVIDGNSNDEELNEKLKPCMIRHLKKEVLPDLKKLRMSIPIQINLNKYNKALKEYKTALEKRESEAIQLQLLMKAKKSLADEKTKYSIEFAKEIISQDEKVIIVTCFSSVVEKIENAFKDNVVKIVGGMSDIQKDDAITRFQQGNEQVLVMNIIAGGVGLTLTKAHKMIFNDYDWTVGNITQAEDRICRGGQTELCFIYYMTALGAKEEERLVDMLTKKSKTITDTIDLNNDIAIDFKTMVLEGIKRQG